MSGRVAGVEFRNRAEVSVRGRSFCGLGDRRGEGTSVLLQAVCERVLLESGARGERVSSELHDSGPEVVLRGPEVRVRDHG